MWENADQNNSKYGHFSRSVVVCIFTRGCITVISDHIGTVFLFHFHRETDRKHDANGYLLLVTFPIMKCPANDVILHCCVGIESQFEIQFDAHSEEFAKSVSARLLQK